MMKSWGLCILAFTLCVVAQGDDSCFTEIHSLCNSESTYNQVQFEKKCTAKNKAFKESGNDAVTKAQDLVRDHLTTSLEYLLMGNKFKQWNINRPGFHGYFNKLADEAWQDAIDLIQHMTERGQTPKLAVEAPFQMEPKKDAKYIQASEVELLSMALEKEQVLAGRISDIIKVSHAHHDPEFFHYLSEHLSDKRVLKIKHLANHVNNLYAAILNADKPGESGDHNFAIHTYDTLVLQREM